LETLSLRCKAHCENANQLAEWLNGHEAVKAGSVLSISLPSHPSHELAKKYFRPSSFGSVFTFELAGDTEDQARERGKKFITALKMCAHLANVGDARTLVIHPASTTHQQLTTEQQIAAGVKPAGVRISVGYEDLEDIKADIDQAFAVARA
jgi:O-acetylhomoserine/O-acetylserine sulfhydrylase-like pyridoxal-dependent enzyme